MQYISLNNSSLTYFTVKGEITELSGSSKYNVFDNVIVKKDKRPNGKIENRTAILEYLHTQLNDKKADVIFERIAINYKILYDKCRRAKFTSETDLNRLEQLKIIIDKHISGGAEFVLKSAIINKTIQEQNSRYKTRVVKKSDIRTINKSKVKGKMYALFNLKCSQKFIAFYSVSFPINTTDESAFVCWNNWLTQLRKRFNLTNYIWVSERQKNGTLHYHMLTNHYMNILQINRVMAIVINNQVESGLMSWGGSSLERYNGVDVDSIYNSKRHKKTGKTINSTQLRDWISKYVTKYVTKNNEKFTHLCWHCSRSISQLFTSTILLLSDSRKITDFLPRLRHLYINYKGEFNDTWLFKFVPPEHLFAKIRMYNDRLFVGYEPQIIEHKININYKTKKL